jgi:hypothetical protein
MACSPSTHTIAVGTELAHHRASILLWDVRSSPSPSPKAQYHEVHSDDVTDLSFHPSHPSLLMSGSTDGLVNVCDTRIADEDEVVVQTFNLGASIHRARFLGGGLTSQQQQQQQQKQEDTAGVVMALSHDERFALYNITEEESASGDALCDFGDLREGLACQYVADVLPKADGSGAVLGIGAQEYVSVPYFLSIITKPPLPR